MFMNLSRKFSKADKYARGWQATDFDGAVVEEEGKPTAAGASPYSYFYPEEVSVNLGMCCLRVVVCGIVGMTISLTKVARTAVLEHVCGVHSLVEGGVKQNGK